MKRLVLFTTLLLLFTSYSYAQWYPRSDGLPEGWWSWKIDAYDSLIAVGPHAQDSIYLTINSGNNWNAIPFPNSAQFLDFVDISIIGTDHIWYCTGSGEIFGTTNGGMNWDLQFFDTSMTRYMNYIEMFDSLNGIAMGDAGSYSKPTLFLKTTDGGINWISMNDTSIIGLWSGDWWRRVDFINTNIGYFFSSGENPQKLYKTSDGGKQWRMINDTISCQILKFYDEYFGIIKSNECAGGQCTPGIHRTTDGGETWEVMTTEFWGWGDDIEFIPGNPSKLWCIVNETGFYSSDSGRTWTEEFNVIGSTCFDIKFTDIDHGWLLTANNLYYTSTSGLGGIVGAEEESIIQLNYQLSHNYPNPFNPTTKINYQIPERSFTTIKVYDVLGNEIEILVNEEKPIGTHTIEFDASNLPSGIYFYQLTAQKFTQTKKMILLR